MKKPLVAAVVGVVAVGLALGLAAPASADDATLGRVCYPTSANVWVCTSSGQ